MSIVTYENVDTPVFEIDYLRYLFANGEAGLYLPYQPDHLYADVANTVPAVLGGGIASFDDLSGNGVTGPQPTSTARPILGRVPRTGARNTVANSTLLGSGYSGALAEAEPAGEGPRGSAVQISRTATGVAFWMLTQPEQSAWEVGETYIATIAIKNVDAAQSRLRATGINYEITVNWSDPVASGLIPVDGWPDWYLMGQTFVASDPQTISNRRIYIYPEVSSSLSSGSVIVSGLQVEVGEETTPYQNVATPYDVTEAGVPSVHYAHYDLADDVLPRDALLPAITDGTVILIGRNGIWIDEGYSFAGGDWSFGPTTYTDGPRDIISVVGDMLDLVVLDRPLTADERDRVVAYGVKRGSAGLIELGPELVVNGTFDSDTSGWVGNNANATLTWQPGGTAIFENTADFAFVRSVSNIGLTSGVYLQSFDLIARNLPNSTLHIGLGVAGVTIGSAGHYSRTYVSSGSSVQFQIRPNGAGTGTLEIDNISVRRLIMPGDTP